MTGLLWFSQVRASLTWGPWFPLSPRTPWFPDSPFRPRKPILPWEPGKPVDPIEPRAPLLIITTKLYSVQLTKHLLSDQCLQSNLWFPCYLGHPWDPTLHRHRHLIDQRFWKMKLESWYLISDRSRKTFFTNHTAWSVDTFATFITNVTILSFDTYSIYGVNRWCAVQLVSMILISRLCTFESDFSSWTFFTNITWFPNRTSYTQCTSAFNDRSQC